MVTARRLLVLQGAVRLGSAQYVMKFARRDNRRQVDKGTESEN